MRCAAYNAKLVPNFDSSNLILCLEPEGISFAALFDASQDDTFIRDYVGEESKESFSTKDVFSRRGNKFLAVDAGGGTVDFGAYEVMSTHPFKVKQLAAPVGGPFGSTQVDHCFKEFIFELIGPEATAMLRNDLSSLYELLSKWEMVKVNAGPHQERRSVIPLADLVTNILSPLDLDLRSLVETYRASHSSECVNLRGETRLELSEDFVKELFSKSLHHIVQTVRDYAREIEYVVLAGGYSQCPYIWNDIAEEFEHLEDRMFLVSKPDTAIVRSASIYGSAHQAMVTHRVSRLTYGLKRRIQFDPLNEEHLQRFSEAVKDDRGFLHTLF